MDSRDSLDQTLDSIDLTKSPVKYINTQGQMQKINEDTSDDDTDEKITFDDDKAKKTKRRDIKVQRKRAKTVKTKKGRTTKKCILYIYRKKEIIETKKRKNITECKR